jgi:hypothetical protein
VSRLWNLLVDLQSCQVRADFGLVAAHHGDIYWAYDLATRSDMDGENPYRHEIQARLLTDATDAEIADRISTTPGVIEAFAACFYDVRPYRQKRSYLMHHVLGPEIYSGFQPNNFSLLWKLGAITGGTPILDALIEYAGSAWGVTDLTSWYDSLFRSRMGYNAAVTAMSLKPNNFTACDILDRYLKIREQDREQGGSASSSQKLMDVIHSALQTLPVSLRDKTVEGDDCDALQLSRSLGVELGPGERLSLRLNGDPGLPGGIPLDAYVFPAPQLATATEGDNG